MKEQASIFGYIQSPIDVRDYKLSDISEQAKSIPEEYKVQTLYIKNQKNKSTCVAHACSECVEYHNYRQERTKVKFSTDFIYGLRDSGYYIGEGMCIRDALKTLNHYGDCPHSDLSSNSNYPIAAKLVSDNRKKLEEKAYPNRISEYYKITSLDELKFAIYTYGPVVAGMKWFNDATLSSENVYTYSDQTKFGGHAVLIIGYTKDYIIIQNSWGSAWGQGGKFYVKCSDVFDGDSLFYEAYGIKDNIQARDDTENNTDVVIKPNWFIKVFGFIINFFVRLFNKKE